MTAFLTSLSTTVGLLAAIGAQNAFVIESAILKRNIIFVAMTCILSDFVMISCGFLGLSQVIKSHPQAQLWLAWIGIVFLVYYGALKLRDSFQTQTLENQNQQPMTVKSSIVKALAFSWLNPHVYLDTVILIPALALQYTDENRYFAAAGGYSGVVVWFVGVSILGIASARFFKDPLSWKILNVITAAIMFWVAVHLYMTMG